MRAASMSASRPGAAVGTAKRLSVHDFVELTLESFCGIRTSVSRPKQSSPRSQLPAMNGLRRGPCAVVMRALVGNAPARDDIALLALHRHQAPAPPTGATLALDGGMSS